MHQYILIKPLPGTDYTVVYPNLSEELKKTYETELQEFPGWHFSEGYGRSGDGPFFTANVSVGYVESDAKRQIVYCDPIPSKYTQLDFVQETLNDKWKYYCRIWMGTGFIFGEYVYYHWNKSRERWDYYSNAYYRTSKSLVDRLDGYLMTDGVTNVSIPKQYQDDPDRCLAYLAVGQWTLNRHYRSTLITDSISYEPEKPDISEFGLKYGEYEYWYSRAYNIPRGFTWGCKEPLHANLFTNAYYQAQSALPELHQNTTLNVIQTAESLFGLLGGFDLSDANNLYKAAKNLWLQYRYVYSTTKSDIEEIAELAYRLENLILDGYPPISARGFAGDETGNFRCTIKTRRGQTRAFLKSRDVLNLRPNLQDIWDAVPWSFFIDWFTQFGSLLEGLDNWMKTPEIGSCELWYSYTNTYTLDTGAVVSVYFRFPGHPPAFPLIEWKNKSGKTWGMRVADSVSLFL